MTLKYWLRLLGLVQKEQLPFPILGVTVTIQVDDAEDPVVIKFFKDTENLRVAFLGQYQYVLIDKKKSRMFLVITDAKEDEDEHFP